MANGDGGLPTEDQVRATRGLLLLCGGILIIGIFTGMLLREFFPGAITRIFNAVGVSGGEEFSNLADLQARLDETSADLEAKRRLLGGDGLETRQFEGVAVKMSSCNAFLQSDGEYTLTCNIVIHSPNNDADICIYGAETYEVDRSVVTTSATLIAANPVLVYRGNQDADPRCVALTAGLSDRVGLEFYNLGGLAAAPARITLLVGRDENGATSALDFERVAINNSANTPP